jgi:F-type H+-transporting ATPase subunit a
MTYQFIASTVRETVGNEGKAYFPFIFTLFMFILFCNLFGLFPGSFTVTSHIIVTFALAAVIFVGLTFVAISKHGFGAFITRFFPKGLPLPVAILMGPMIYGAELLSFLARPVSLSVRLAANMVAGHVMLKVFAGFVIAMGAAGIVPLFFMVILSGFEFGVALLQAYIFTVLTCIYLSDVLHAH